MSTRIVPSLQYDVIVVKKRRKEEEKKIEKSFVIGMDLALGPSKNVFTNFKVGRWIKNCGKIKDAQEKKGTVSLGKGKLLNSF